MSSTLEVAALARAVHAEWRADREAKGWRYGQPDPYAKTSPYLKPIEAFSAREWRRERWLALTDLMAVAAAPHMPLTALFVSASALGRARAPHAVALIDEIGRRAHAAWRIINLRFDIDDLRISQSFDALDDDAKARSRANIRCDLAAIAALARSYATQTSIAIMPCADMLGEALFWEDLSDAQRRSA